MQQQRRKYSPDLEYMKLYEAHSKHTQIPWTDSRQVMLQPERTKLC